MKQRTTIYLDDQDRQAIKRIGHYYGISSDSDVIRFVVRKVAREVEQYISGEESQHRQKDTDG